MEKIQYGEMATAVPRKHNNIWNREVLRYAIGEFVD
jgi:hypothetical protein